MLPGLRRQLGGRCLPRASCRSEQRARAGRWRGRPGAARAPQLAHPGREQLCAWPKAACLRSSSQQGPQGCPGSPPPARQSRPAGSVRAPGIRFPAARGRANLLCASSAPSCGPVFCCGTGPPPMAAPHLQAPRHRQARPRQPRREQLVYAHARAAARRARAPARRPPSCEERRDVQLRQQTARETG